jgi:hypothetical protein
MGQIESATTEYVNKIGENLSELVAKSIAYDALVSGNMELFSRMLKILGNSTLVLQVVEPNNSNKWIYPKSEAIRKYWYNDFKEELHVQWLTGETIYTFYNVPMDVFKVLNHPDTSKGKYMNYVKIHYTRSNF